MNRTILKAVQCHNPFVNILSNYSKQSLSIKNAAKAQSKDIYSNKTSTPTVETISCDMIGPPHLISNLRPIIRHKSPNETTLQKKLRDLQNETQQWNQIFWENHNTKFVKEKEEYVLKHGKGEKQLTAEEMSDFYKEFLDKNWKNHVNYNFSWYKKNFRILFLTIGVHIQSLFNNNNNNKN